MNRAPYFHCTFNPEKPNYEAFPEMRFVDYYDFTIEGGDIMYLPSGWWHHVVNPTASIGFGFRWFSIIDAVRNSLTQVIVSLTASNPSILTLAKNRDDFTKVFSCTK